MIKYSIVDDHPIIKIIRVEPMIDRKILISIVIVLLIGVAAASYQITTKTPGVWQPSVSQAPLATEQGSSDRQQDRDCQDYNKSLLHRLLHRVKVGQEELM